MPACGAAGACRRTACLGRRGDPVVGGRAGGRRLGTRGAAASLAVAVGLRLVGATLVEPAEQIFEGTAMLLARMRRGRDAYLRWGRDTLGWSVYLFATPRG